MSTITLTAENKVNSIALTMEAKLSGATTWDDATYIWNQATGTWDLPGLVIIEEDKINNIALVLETK